MSTFNLGSRPAALLVRSASRLIALACMTFVLAACGGGGGGDGGGSNTPTSNPPPATPTADDQAKAQNARVRMNMFRAALLVGEHAVPSSVRLLLDITWFDTFDNETGYKIERRANGANTWQVLKTLPAVDGGSTRWQETIDDLTGSGAYRVSATFRDFSLPLHVTPGESEVNVEVTLLPPELRTAADPNGDLRVSLAGVAPAQSVEYYLASAVFGSVPVGSSTEGPDFAVTVPSNRLISDSVFSLNAVIRKSAGLTIATTDLLSTNSPGPALLLRVAPAAATENSLLLTARASAVYGIERVQFFANGQLVRELNTPDRSGNWVHALDPATLPSSVNTFRAVATDAHGDTASMDVEYTIDTAIPALSVSGPFDGMIVSNGRLDVHGTFGENAPGTVLTIDIGTDPPLLRTRTSPFNLEYSFGDRTGDRILTVRAESPTGKVNTRSYLVIFPSTPRAYELLGTDVDALLAVDDGLLLYRKPSGEVMLRNAAGVATPVPVPPGMSFSQWWLAAGKIVAEERVNHHLHVFTGPGQTLDLTPSWISVITRPTPSVRGHWLSFSSGLFELSAHDLTTGVTVRFPVAATQLQTRSDIDTTPGSERVLFLATINGTAGVYSYGLHTGATDLLLSGPYYEVLTDSTLVAARTDSRRIDAGLLSNPTALTTLADDGGLNFVKDGLIGFSGIHNGELIGAELNDGSSTTRLATFGSLDSTALQDGYVVFNGAGLQCWSRSTGETTLLLDASAPVMHTQGVAYFRTGRTPGAFYRTTLP